MHKLLVRGGALAVATVASITLVACGATPEATPTPSSPTATPTPAPATFTDEQVQTVAKLEEMRGHLYSSVANADAENFPMARMHAGHPYQEGYLALESEITAADSSLAARASQTLQQNFSAVANSTDPADFAAGAAEDNAIIDQMAAALIPATVRASLSFRAAVLAALLEHGADEYSESVHDGVVDVLEEYQDGYGFYNRGKQIWAEIEGQIKAASPTAYSEIEDQFDKLDAAMPAVMPPASAVAGSGVLAWVEEVARELEDAAGATPSGEPSTGDSAADDLSGLTHELDEALQALDRGDIAGAQAAYTEFDDGWFDIEDGVRAKSRDAYRDIEEAMSIVKNELIRPESPDVDKAKSAIQALDRVIDAALPDLR